MYCHHEDGGLIELSDGAGKKMQRMVRIGLQCGFDEMWLGNGCGLINVNKENETAITDQLQRNSRLKLSGKLLSTNQFRF